MPIIFNANQFAPAGDAVAFEPQRQNNFVAQIEPPNAVGADGEGVKHLMVTLEKFPFPEEKSVKKSIKFQNTTIHYAGSQDPVSEITLTYRDFIDRQTALVWQQWRRAVMDTLSGNVGFAYQYKTKGTLFKLPPGNGAIAQNTSDFTYENDQYTRKWGIFGVWPMSYKETDYDATNDGDIVTVEIGLSIDFVRGIGNGGAYPDNK